MVKERNTMNSHSASVTPKGPLIRRPQAHPTSLCCQGIRLRSPLRIAKHAKKGNMQRKCPRHTDQFSNSCHPVRSEFIPSLPQLG